MIHRKGWSGFIKLEYCINMIFLIMTKILHVR